MGWVNHKKIRERIASKRSAISDETFFTSRIFVAHLEEIVAVQLNRYKYRRRVRIKIFWNTKDPFIAATDHTVIMVNAGNPLVTKEESRTDRYHVIVGLVVHELGHVLYTDYKESKRYFENFMEYRWYPTSPKLTDRKYVDNAKDFLNYAKADNENRDILMKVAKNIINIIEDGYVENRMLCNFPGTLGYALDKMRVEFKEQLPTITQLKEKEDGDNGLTFFSIMQIMLSYALYGDIKYGEESSDDERVQAVYKLLTKIDYSIMSRDYKDRLCIVNEIMICCWDHLKAFCERSKEMAKMGKDTTAVIDEAFSSLIGISMAGKGDTAPVSASDDEKPMLITMENRKKTISEIAEKTEKEYETETEVQTEDCASESSVAEESSKSDDVEIESDEGETDGEDGEKSVSGDTDGEAEESSEESVDEEPTPEIGNEEMSEEEESDVDGDEERSEIDEEQLSLDDVEDETDVESSDEIDDDFDDESDDTEKTQEADSEELSHDADDRLKLPDRDGEDKISDEDCAEYSEGGSVERDEEYEHLHNTRAAAEIQDLLDTMAERAACNELEEERISELNELAKEISYGDIHEGVDVKVHRISEVPDSLKEEYESISEPLVDISKRLARALQKHIEDKRRGGKVGGLMMGRRLDTSAVHRSDGKMFYKKNAPDERSEIAVALLVDESGSMWSSERCVYARAVSIILQDFCERLSIPIMIYGHSTDYCRGDREPVALYSYAEFESYDSDDKYRLMDITARNNNRDGAALRFVSEQLSKRSEEIKLLIQICDGQPYAERYGGASAEADLTGIKIEYERRGLVYVVAAIGEDKGNIERIYGNSFLDITNLDELPTKLTSIVKKYIRV